MRTLKGVTPQGCVFGCPDAADRIEHYARCSHVWDFVAKPLPIGLGIEQKHRSLQGFLMLDKDMSLTQKLAMATAAYAVSRTSAQVREAQGTLALGKLFLLHAKEGLRGSKARRLLKDASRG